MEVNYATKKLADTLTQHKRRVREYGALAEKIHRRILELIAADTLEVMRFAPGRCHELKGDRAGELAVSITGNLRLIFRPHDDPPPTKGDGGLDWTAVTAITILEVTDYHGA